jgi:transglutaminase-like putative cysteine protease
MLKRIIILVILIIFAKPTYDVLSPYVQPLLPVMDVETTTVNTLPVQTTSVINGETVQSELNYPNAVQSVETLADAMYYYFSQFETNFTIQYVGNTQTLSEMIEEASTLASKRDPFIEGHLSMREITYTYTRSSAKIDVKQQYLVTAAQVASIDATVDEILAQNNAHSLSDFDKIKFVNDFIVQNTVYSTNTTNSPHSAYTVLAEGKGVCQGYALLAQKMLTKLGIESLYVVGEAGGVGHAWNLVKLNGGWYHIDTTWNDPTPDRGPNNVRYAYFLMSDRQLANDHTWEIQDYPQAVDEQYAYLHIVSDRYEMGDYIYFSHEQDNNFLYRLHKSSKQVDKVANIRVQYLTGDGDWLYFSNYSNGGFLSKMHISGNDEALLVREKVKNLFILDGFLYFSTDNGNQKIQL